MKKILIATKNKTKLISKLEDSFDIEYFKTPSLISKISFQKIVYPDIYFHTGLLDKLAIDLILNSKIVIVNANGVKESIKKKVVNIDLNKIYVVYPYFDTTTHYNDQIKQNFREQHNIPLDINLILFSAKDLNKGGIKAFLTIVSQIQEKKFQVVIDGDKKQIEQLQLIVNRSKFDFRIILLSDYENKDKLFISSDIYIAPTTQKQFNKNILKAMYFHNVVFVTSSNYSAEIVDTFSVMSDIDDLSTPYKIDALLSNVVEIKQIQQDNYDSSLQFNIDNQLEIIKLIILKLS